MIQQNKHVHTTKLKWFFFLQKRKNGSKSDARNFFGFYFIRNAFICLLDLYCSILTYIILKAFKFLQTDKHCC